MCCLIDLAPESDVCSAFWIDCLIMQNEGNISRTTQTGQNKSIEPTARSLRKRGWQWQLVLVLPRVERDCFFGPVKAGEGGN